ncbi:MAG: hypothetical protein ACLUVG_04735 [Phocaeicola vulgatus]
MSDLDSAATLLPITQEEVGRATKGAAIAEKAIISNFMNKYKKRQLNMQKNLLL